MSVRESSLPAAAMETVLIVEDDVLVRTGIAVYLRDCGFRVIETASTDEALVVLNDPNMAVDIVFGNVRMPGSMDGFGLAKWVRQHRPGLEVVLAGTVEKAADAAGELCENGPDLKKPYEPQQVLEWIRTRRASVKR